MSTSFTAPARPTGLLPLSGPGSPPSGRRALLPPAAALSYGGGLAAALAVAVLAIVLALPGGTPGAPSLSAAAALAVRGPAMAGAGGRSRTSPASFSTLFQGIYFPDWSGKFHWRASGQRTDTINGRTATPSTTTGRGIGSPTRSSVLRR